MIKLVNVRKHYSLNENKSRDLAQPSGNLTVAAVDGISLDIPKGSIFGIIGRSGAGKSTLVRLISLLEQPDSGEIYFNTRRVDNLKGKDILECRTKLGMIFQNFNLFNSRNALGNVCYPMEITKVPKKEREQRAYDLLELVGLSDKALSPVSKLSGGQKQRVAIARALANNPEILFCDEATSALDPKTTHSILKLIKEIQTKINLTVVMITHQMEVVKEICDNVAVISDGKIVETGTVKDIFSFPSSEVTQEFLSGLGGDLDEFDETVLTISKRYRLRFLDGSAKEPVISSIIKKFDLEVNILSGVIRTVNNTPIGELVVEFYGDGDNVTRAYEWLGKKNVKVEQIND